VLGFLENLGEALFQRKEERILELGFQNLAVEFLKGPTLDLLILKRYLAPIYFNRLEDLVNLAFLAAVDERRGFLVLDVSLLFSASFFLFLPMTLIWVGREATVFFLGDFFVVLDSVPTDRRSLTGVDL
tara:strand:- start:51 stop:437 length:387 start_codon:yes stop_codon:yes gene_type:complete